MAENPFAPMSRMSSREGTSPPKNSFQKELDQKMKERKRQGLTSALSPSEDDSDALSSDNELLGNFGSSSGNRFMKTKSSDQPGSQKMKDGKLKHDLLYGNKDFDDSDDEPSNLLATMKKPWQPPSMKKTSKSPKSSRDYDDVDATLSRNPTWQPPQLQKKERPKSPGLGRRTPPSLGSMSEKPELKSPKSDKKNTQSSKAEQKQTPRSVTPEKTPRSKTPEKEEFSGKSSRVKSPLTANQTKSEKKGLFGSDSDSDEVLSLKKGSVSSKSTTSAKGKSSASSEKRDSLALDLFGKSKKDTSSKKSSLLDSSSEEEDEDVGKKQQKPSHLMDFMKEKPADSKFVKKDPKDKKSTEKNVPATTSKSAQSKFGQKSEKGLKTKGLTAPKQKEKASSKLLEDSDSDSIGEEMGRGKEGLRRGQGQHEQDDQRSFLLGRPNSGAHQQDPFSNPFASGPAGQSGKRQVSFESGQSFGPPTLSEGSAKKEDPFSLGPPRLSKNAREEHPSRGDKESPNSIHGLLEDQDQKGQREKGMKKSTSDNLNSSFCEDYEVDPSPMRKHPTAEEQSIAKHSVTSHTKENQRNDDAINTVKQEQSKQDAKKGGTTKKRPLSSRYSRSLTVPSTPTGPVDMNSSVGIREAIYNEWYQQRIQSARLEKAEKTKKEKEEEKQKEEEKLKKEQEAKNSYRAWLEKKKEMQKEQLIKKKEASEAEEVQKKEEERRKLKEKKKNFERWKESKDEEIIEKHKEKLEKEKEEKRQKEEEKKRKSKDAQSAFQKWDKKKEESIKQKEEEKRKEKAKQRKEEREAQEAKQKEAEERYKKWLHRKEEQPNQSSKKLSFADEDRPQWRPSSKTVPFGR